MRDGEAGFTLIETLVALAVLAMTAVGLLASAQAHISRIGALETRAAAGWAAENYLAEVGLGLTPQTTVPMLGMQFQLAAESEATTDADVSRLTVTATDMADGQVYARLSGFALTERLQVQP